MPAVEVPKTNRARAGRRSEEKVPKSRNTMPMSRVASVRTSRCSTRQQMSKRAPAAASRAAGCERPLPQQYINGAVEAAL